MQPHTTTPRGDGALARRAAVDPAGAFAEIVTRYGPVVYTLALRLCDQPADAEDLAAETFARAWRALCRQPAEQTAALRLRAWLVTIVLNTWRNQVPRLSGTGRAARGAEPAASHPRGYKMSSTGVISDEQLHAALRRLRAQPPAGFTERVLTGAGLGVEADRYVRTEGPLGAVYVAFNVQGICHVLPAGAVDDDPARFESVHRARFGRPADPAVRAPAGLGAALRSGRARGLRYDLRGLSEFDSAVLHAALDIPHGEARPYAWIAARIGRPTAQRAVGSALGRNPVPLLIPCHRVIRSDGEPGDYAFGSGMKRRLLDREGVDLHRARQLARAGVRYLGSDTTNIYCLPTCHNARRITPRHQVPFAAAAQAEAAGYRPCHQCQPTAQSA